MKNAHRNILLAATAALALAVAPSALADVRIHVNLPLPPPPHVVVGHHPPLLAPVVEFGYRSPGRRSYDGRWNYENRHRDDRYGRRYRDRARWAFVEGRWVVRPYRGAVWVDGHYDLHGRRIPGYWVRARYR
ncbi:MAG: hypothetical protein HY900_36370 [Deltaproteobacteria bacterium]|nr:hypothetical protein [Deltaproteobacteria bacterium]